MILLLLTLGACAPLDDAGKAPGEDFRKDTDVAILRPTNGETVESPFLLSWQAGADVRKVRLDVGGSELIAATAVGEAGTGEFTVDLEPGRHGLSLVGLDKQGRELSTYTLALRVAEPDASWVNITSPADQSTVPNPVVFAVSASDDVKSIELYADDWPLGTVSPGQLLSYTFSGTGYERQIDAYGLDADGARVASDRIHLTVDEGTTPGESAFNDYVLDMVADYPTDGSYGYYWPSGSTWAGTTQDIWYRGTKVAEGDAQHRSYCSGITWETFMRAAAEVDADTGGDGTINGMTVSNLSSFRTDWYVRELWGDGVGIAVENYGIGQRVTDWADVRPGDYVQIWRHSGSGHTFVFIDWLRDGSGEITGVRYWSTQSSTDGIGYNEEYFGTSGSRISPSHFYVARVHMPDQWVDW